MKHSRLTVLPVLLALTAAAAVTPASADTSPRADPVARAAEYRVTLAASTARAVQKEDRVRLTGRVSPKSPGARVVIQLQYDGKQAWRTIGTTTVKNDGSYVFRDKPVSRLDRRYRVVKAADESAAKGVSRERFVEVFGWDWLDAQSPSASEHVFAAATMPINGVDYGHTLFVDRVYPAGYTEFTLGRRCLLLEATVGLSDRTQSGGQGSVQVAVDGMNVYGRTFGLGESEPLSLDVAGAYRVRLDFSQLPGTPPTEPSAGAARVLCD